MHIYNCIYVYNAARERETTGGELDIGVFACMICYIYIYTVELRVERGQNLVVVPDAAEKKRNGGL